MRCREIPKQLGLGLSTTLQHFDGIVPSVASIVTKQHDSIRGRKYLLKTPRNANSEILNFIMSLYALALKNLCLWCEFQSYLLIIISLLLENFLTALSAWLMLGRRGLCPQGSLPFPPPKSAVY